MQTKISEAWVKTHGFTLPCDLLLKENMIERMWRELRASQRRLSLRLMETPRIQSSIAPKTGVFVLASKFGEPMTTKDFVGDVIGTSMET